MPLQRLNTEANFALVITHEHIHMHVSHFSRIKAQKMQNFCPVYFIEIWLIRIENQKILESKMLYSTFDFLCSKEHN